MTNDVVRLVVLNALFFAGGIGLLPTLRIARTRHELLRRLPSAYMIGLASFGILGATLELISVPLGLLEVAFLAVACVGGGVLALMSADTEHSSPSVARGASRAAWVLAAVMLIVSLALVARAGHAWVVRPLREYDGWAIWALKARALFEFGGVEESVFANPVYDAPTHPLLLPSLEAMGFRAMGGFDGTVIHLQLAGLLLGFVGAAWVVLRAVASPVLVAATLLAVVSAPAVMAQLGTNFADIPLALFISLAVAASAAWLRSRENWLLSSAAIFLAAAALTKSEGMLFAVCAVAALAVVASRRAPGRLALVAGAVALAILPWRVYVSAHDLRHPDYELSNLVDRSYLGDTSYRVRPVVDELLLQLTSLDAWGLLLPMFGIGLGAALIRRRYALALFALGWLASSFAGLVAIYWITVRTLEFNLFNTSNRIVASLLLGAALLAPILAAEPDPVPEPEPQ